MLRDKKGVHNSYCSPDSINRLDWDNLKRYPEVFEYYSRLISLRKAHPAFRLRSADEVRRHLEFLDAPSGVVAFRLKENAGGDEWNDIIVILNANKQEQDIAIPDGNYTIVAKDGRIDADGIGLISNGKATIGKQQAMILHN